MDSNLLARIHVISVMLFLITYVIKTVLLFSNKPALDKYSRITKVPEMIISFCFFVTGIWLLIILGGTKTMLIVKIALVLASIPLAVVGFKKYNKGLALLALLFIVSAYGIAEMSKNKPFNTATPPKTLNEGAKVYYTNCVFCHGEDGKKMYRNASDLTLSKFDESAIQQMIREGSKGKMPAYKLIISDENIAAVATYVNNMKPALADSLKVY